MAALSGHLLDLADPEVLDQADEISGDLLAVAERLQPDGDRLLVLDDAVWFTPFDAEPVVAASCGLIGRVLDGLADRLAYLPGDHLSLVDPGGAVVPRPVERPPGWWLDRGWVAAGDGIVVHTLAD